MAVTIPNFIRGINMFPKIHIYYWTEEQQQYCREYQSRFQRFSIILDARGSMFQSLVLPYGCQSSKRLYLYIIFLVNQFNENVPLCQMITDSHDTVSISEWLFQWLKDVRCHPNEAISDDSSALVAANVRTFTGFTCVEDYLIRCFRLLNGYKEEVPKTFVRVDTIIFMKAVYNFTCFENVDRIIRNYYINCIRYIKECQDFALVKKILSKIVQLCLYQNDCDSGFRKIKKNLDNLLKKHKDDAFKNDNRNEELECDQIVFENIVAWFDLLVENERKSNAENLYVSKNGPYYFPVFIPTLKRLAINLPLWSNVMCPYFKSKTLSLSSSSVKSHFHNLKQIVLKQKTPRQCIGVYLLRHYEFIKAELDCALNRLQNIGPTVDNKRILHQNKNHMKQIQLKRKDFTSYSIFSDNPSYKMNCQDESNTHHPLKKDDEMVFIRNGYDTPKKSSGYFNTCGLDSAIYLIGQACVRSLAFKSFLVTLKTDCVINYIFMLLNGADNTQKIYNYRTKVAKCFFRKKDCSCHVAYIFQRLCLKYFASAQYYKTCIKCNKFNLRVDQIYIFLNYIKLKLYGISNLEKAIYFFEENTMCEKCNAYLKCELKLGEIITFELSDTGDSVLLTELPVNINVRSYIYFLVGCIEYIPGTTIGHYKCHFLNNNRYYCYDDSSLKIKISTRKRIIIEFLVYARLNLCALD